MCDEEDALIAAILADPADDLPRLVYADWLGEHGREDRAEFIRLQCLAAGQETNDGDGSAWCDRCENYAWPEKFTKWCRGDVCRVRRRLATLLARHRGVWVAKAFVAAHESHTRHILSGNFRPTPPLTDGPFLWLFRRGLATFRRGFVAEIRLPLAAFLAHAQAIFTRHPVERVTLTDREPEGVPGSEQAWWLAEFLPVGPTVEAYTPYTLPGCLWRELAGGDLGPSGANRYYPDEFDAADAVSAACVAYGRELAGLPPIPTEATA